jgi:hypothetical protein
LPSSVTPPTLDPESNVWYWILFLIISLCICSNWDPAISLGIRGISANLWKATTGNTVFAKGPKCCNLYTGKKFTTSDVFTGSLLIIFL